MVTGKNAEVPTKKKLALTLEKICKSAIKH